MKNKALLICLIIALILCSMPVAAFAATAGNVKTVYAGSTVNLRAGPGTNHESLGLVKDGDAITVNFQGAEWSNVTVNKTGKSGYIKNTYVKLSTTGGSNVTTGAAKVYVSANGGSLHVRAGAGTNFASKGYVKHGDAITVISKGSEWSKIKVTRTGVEGYLKNKYIVMTSASGSGSTGTGTPVTVETYTAAVVTTKTAQGKVNVRTGAGTGFDSIATLKRGTALYITSVYGDWYKLINPSNGAVGYMHKNYVSVGRKAVTTAELNLRAGASTSSIIITELAKGAEITVIDVANGWAKVSVGSNNGYVDMKFVQYK